MRLTSRGSSGVGGSKSRAFWSLALWAEQASDVGGLEDHERLSVVMVDVGEARPRRGLGCRLCVAGNGHAESEGVAGQVGEPQELARFGTQRRRCCVPEPHRVVAEAQRTWALYVAPARVVGAERGAPAVPGEPVV